MMQSSRRAGLTGAILAAATIGATQAGGEARAAEPTCDGAFTVIAGSGAATYFCVTAAPECAPHVLDWIKWDLSPGLPGKDVAAAYRCTGSTPWPRTACLSGFDKHAGYSSATKTYPFRCVRGLLKTAGCAAGYAFSSAVVVDGGFRYRCQRGALRQQPEAPQLPDLQPKPKIGPPPVQGIQLQ
jgi:hypothetical protein